MNPSGLYIHVPFCRSKCGYCDFYSETSSDLIPVYLKALPMEMRRVRYPFRNFDTVYFGGGTPSLLKPEDLEGILSEAFDHFDLSDEREVTLEANPADLTPAYLRALRDMGISRLNIGVQSFDQSILNFLGRRHTVQDARAAVDGSRKAGFDNLGLDLICGVPGMEIESWIDGLKTALSFGPEHLSCYQLSLSPAVPLGRILAEGRFSLPDEERSFRLYMKTAETLEAAGYVHYEVSNYARDLSRVSRHNQKYWDHSPYLGLGPGAHSYFHPERWWNHRSVMRYFDDLERDVRPVEGSEEISKENLTLETLFLRLRTSAGSVLRGFRERTGMDLLENRRETIQRLEAEGFIVIREGHLRPTLRGFAVADRLPLML